MQNLQKEQATLHQKELELLHKEKELAHKEEELTRREQKLDSSLKQENIRTNTSYFNQPSLAGLWQVKMTCTETSCPGSAVGDTKTEQWDLSYQGNTLVAKAMAGNKLLRIYTGLLTGNTAQLEEVRQSSTSQPATTMAVRLQILDESTMEGQREIVRNNECKIVYVLQLKKQS